MEYSMDTSIRRLDDNAKIREERLIAVTRNSTISIMINRATIKKQKWEENNYMDISREKLTRGPGRG